ncbi:MAG: hypothetical protein COT81_05655 [Candidatus Buchananbacteria bacterium CG10_big_fil_rev_8_21_14_0_10_42_9]|uniref:Type 4 fimbrial biogenesis protein PilX N-terminal domain-containing protein n=1 Tax=Candidatus Buchananbacteria bacterium CG10_big_fil_rev_8_21_14_0_10_42_9 TaxID=1974526 RepID=A0A2H0W277_9BACT|nr:MAG: hypothetical protein COT81_05655 [Candidatus Buchananbacteria bacterium CG10_big_fil_rev_8_21_14_0_10_42_9]
MRAKKRYNFKDNHGGYIAMISLLIISAVILSIGLSVNSRSAEELSMGFAASRAHMAKTLAEACLEDALLKLRLDFNSYSDSLVINGNTCIINAVVTAPTAVVTVSGTVQEYTQQISTSLGNSSGTLEITNRQ